MHLIWEHTYIILMEVRQLGSDKPVTIQANLSIIFLQNGQLSSPIHTLILSKASVVIWSCAPGCAQWEEGMMGRRWERPSTRDQVPVRKLHSLADPVCCIAPADVASPWDHWCIPQVCVRKPGGKNEWSKLGLHVIITELMKVVLGYDDRKV